MQQFLQLGKLLGSVLPQPFREHWPVDRFLVLDGSKPAKDVLQDSGRIRLGLTTRNTLLYFPVKQLPNFSGGKTHSVLTSQDVGCSLSNWNPRAGATRALPAQSRS